MVVSISLTVIEVKVVHFQRELFEPDVTALIQFLAIYLMYITSFLTLININY